jgi:heme A synthase
MKLFHSFLWDDVSVTALFNVKNWSLLKTIKKLFMEKDFKSALPNASLGKTLLYIFVQMVHHIFYYLLLLLILLGTINFIRQNRTLNEIHLILIFSLISILMIIITVGAPRYKYHIIILLLPIAANYLVEKLLKSRKEIAKS